MDRLDAHIGTATGLIAEKYFALPIFNDRPKFIERVYCYEFYHQLRRQLTDECDYTLNGEVDKGNHPIFKELGLDAIPDFLIHVPGGGMDRNHTVIEVKKSIAIPISTAMREAIEGDVRKLIRFQRDAHYRRAIYLIYGVSEQDERAVHDAADQARRDFDANSHLELWFHRAAGQPAFLADVL
jgi:hypothetical protein